MAVTQPYFDVTVNTGTPAVVQYWTAFIGGRSALWQQKLEEKADDTKYLQLMLRSIRDNISSLETARAKLQIEDRASKGDILAGAMRGIGSVIQAEVQGSWEYAAAATGATAEVIAAGIDARATAEAQLKLTGTARDAVTEATEAAKKGRNFTPQLEAQFGSLTPSQQLTMMAEGIELLELMPKDDGNTTAAYDRARKELQRLNPTMFENMQEGNAAKYIADNTQGITAEELKGNVLTVQGAGGYPSGTGVRQMEDLLGRWMFGVTPVARGAGEYTSAIDGIVESAAAEGLIQDDPAAITQIQQIAALPYYQHAVKSDNQTAVQAIIKKYYGGVSPSEVLSDSLQEGNDAAQDVITILKPYEKLTPDEVEQALFGGSQPTSLDLFGPLDMSDMNQRLDALRMEEQQYLRMLQDSRSGSRSPLSGVVNQFTSAQRSTPYTERGLAQQRAVQGIAEAFEQDPGRVEQVVDTAGQLAGEGDFTKAIRRFDRNYERQQRSGTRSPAAMKIGGQTIATPTLALEAVNLGSGKLTEMFEGHIKGLQDDLNNQASAQDIADDLVDLINDDINVLTYQLPPVSLQALANAVAAIQQGTEEATEEEIQGHLEAIQSALSESRDESTDTSDAIRFAIGSIEGEPKDRFDGLSDLSATLKDYGGDETTTFDDGTSDQQFIGAAARLIDKELGDIRTMYETNASGALAKLGQFPTKFRDQSIALDQERMRRERDDAVTFVRQGGETTTQTGTDMSGFVPEPSASEQKAAERLTEQARRVEQRGQQQEQSVQTLREREEAAERPSGRTGHAGLRADRVQERLPEADERREQRTDRLLMDAASQLESDPYQPSQPVFYGTSDNKPPVPSPAPPPEPTVSPSDLESFKPYVDEGYQDLKRAWNMGTDEEFGMLNPRSNLDLTTEDYENRLKSMRQQFATRARDEFYLGTGRLFDGVNVDEFTNEQAIYLRGGPGDEALNRLVGMHANLLEKKKRAQAAVQGAAPGSNSSAALDAAESVQEELQRRQEFDLLLDAVSGEQP